MTEWAGDTMSEILLESVLSYAKKLESALERPAAVYEFGLRDFAARAKCRFCRDCTLAVGVCDSRTAHSYGCFEAERKNGLHVYYCPMGLVFVSTVVFDGPRAVCAIVTGPVVVSRARDAACEVPISAAPCLDPSAINALARVQWAISMYLSGRSVHEAEPRPDPSCQPDVRGMEVCGSRYPYEIERRLREMIVSGDKSGAQELINQLLGALYFSPDSDFRLIRERAKDLVALFSRASVGAGVNAQKIFGPGGGHLAEIDRFEALDDLSVFLTSVFYRFVGYAFDFDKFEHNDVMRKAVDYLRENISEKVALDDLAEYVGLSRSCLSALFKTELGVTFTEFFNLMRIEKSKALLLEQRLSLAEIAGLVGYNDQSYFTKVFARRTGISPGRFRKRGRGVRNSAITV
jgi:AraC-like DNA-binding protein